MLTDHWPELRTASLPVYHRSKTPPPPLPRSLPSFGWKRYPSHMIRLNLPKGAPLPFPHSPPGSPPQLRPCPFSPDSNSHMSTSPKADEDGITPPPELASLPTAPRTDRDTISGHALASPSTVESLKFLTINTPKAGANNPSLVDIVTMLDQHSPDFLFLTEIPMHIHSGPLLHTLRNRGYRVHHHPSNAPFQPDGLPEARFPDHITHPGGGCRLAYKKHTSWTTLEAPLNLP